MCRVFVRGASLVMGMLLGASARHGARAHIES